MPLTISGSLADPRAFGDAVARFGARSVSTALRRQGQQALLLGQQYANAELGPPRSGSRRRDKGVSYHSGFEVLYSGLEDFQGGLMKVTVRNRSRHARIIEGGSKEHEIHPNKKKALFWPELGHPIPFVGPPITALHPGTEAHHILKRAALDAMSSGFLGQTIGHANIRISVSRPH